MPKKAEPPASRLPKIPTVKLSRKHFEAVWWTARVEGKSPGELLEELCGALSTARRDMYNAEIARLMKLDAETAKVEAEARQRRKSQPPA